jgi:hypothetical protein
MKNGLSLQSTCTISYFCMMVCVVLVYAFFFPVLLLYYWSVVNYCGQFRITSFPTSLCGGYIDNCVPLPKSF